MSSTNLFLLLGFVSALLVALSHNLSDDGGASVLEHFGIARRLPKSAVYVTILVCTVGGAGVDAMLNGLDVAHALAAAGAAFVGSIFGFVKQQTAAAKAMVLVAVLSFTLQACALFTPANLPKTEETAKDVACIIEHAFLDDPILNTVCNLLTPAQQALGTSTAAAHRAGVAKAAKLGCAHGGAQ